MMGWGINLYQLAKIPIKKVCNIYYLRWWYSGWHYWAFLPGSLLVVTEGEKYFTIGTRKVSMGSGQVTRGQAQGLRTIMMTREVSLLTIAGWMNIRIEPGTLTVYDNQLAGAEIEFIAIIGSKDISYTTGFTPVPLLPVVPPDIAYCEVIIGNQIWMCKNFDSRYPGSKVYNDDEVNRAIYGGLYTFDMVNNPGFAPIGWHVPTLIEWENMLSFIDPAYIFWDSSVPGSGASASAGGKLKETGYIHWDLALPPTPGTDTYNFKALGAGLRYPISGYDKLFKNTYFLTSDSVLRGIRYYALTLKLNYDGVNIGVEELSTNHYLSVRLIKDLPFTPAHKSDWFLPSKNELNEVYSILHLSGLGGFSLDVIGYYSSTENVGIPAWTCFAQRFDTGAPITSSKNSTRHVRPIRHYTSTNVYVLRGTGEAGGLIFKKTDLGGGLYDYYECWTSDISISQLWTNPPQDNIAIGATAQGTAIGTGQGNTTAIISQAGHSGSAAQLCDSFST